MNKKFYEAPESEELVMMAEGFLCTSGVDIDDDDDSAPTGNDPI